MNDPSASTHVPSAELRKSVGARQVCPFCGTLNPKSDLACAKCGMEDTPGTRQATRAKVGPWYVLQSRNPSAPGMSFATLLALIGKGRVTARSIVRGPTTHQLWRFAARVKGISREFGVCWGCGGDIVRSAKVCPNCKRLQEPPINPDILVEGQDPAAQTARGDAPLSIAIPTSHLQVLEQPASPVEMAAFEITGGGGQRGIGRRVLKAFAVAVVLAIVGVGAMFVIDPSLWQQVKSAAASRWEDSTPRPAPANAPPAASRAETPRVESSDPVAVGPPPVASTKPAVKPPRTRPDDVQISPAAPLTVAQARTRAAELRAAGYAAAGRGEWADAYKAWQEMARLPKEAQHSDLEQKLRECRERLGLQH